MKTAAILVMAAGFFSAAAQAQFDVKDKNGVVRTRPTGFPYRPPGSPTAPRQGEHLQMNFSKVGDAYLPAQNGAIFNPDKVWTGNGYEKRDIRMGHMDREIAAFFSKWVKHGDGSYTTTNRGDSSVLKDNRNAPLIQETYSANQVLIQTREVTMNAEGFPGEVIIRDANGIFKYRGKMEYVRIALAKNVLGEESAIVRLKRELIYDKHDKLLRRIEHHYKPDGTPLQDGVHDYVENIPEDIELVITKGEATTDPLLNMAPTEGEKINPLKKIGQGVFGKKDKKEPGSNTGPVRKKNGIFSGFRNRDN